MPRVKLTKTVIDALPTPSKDIVHWDNGCPGFGVKVTPKGRKVFVVLYRTAGAGSRLRKYTIGPYGRVTLNQARVTAQKVFAAKLDGRDLAAEKKDSRRRMVADRVDDLLEAFPLYVPPGSVPKQEVAAYNDLAGRMTEALYVKQNGIAYKRLATEQEQLLVFQPMITHSISETTGHYVFHVQLIADFLTIEE